MKHWKCPVPIHQLLLLRPPLFLAVPSLYNSVSYFLLCIHIFSFSPNRHTHNQTRIHFSISTPEMFHFVFCCDYLAAEAEPTLAETGITLLCPGRLLGLRACRRDRCRLTPVFPVKSRPVWPGNRAMCHLWGQPCEQHLLCFTICELVLWTHTETVFWLCNTNLWSPALSPPTLSWFHSSISLETLWEWGRKGDKYTVWISLWGFLSWENIGKEGL